jgi:hypothetical protein
VGLNIVEERDARKSNGTIEQPKFKAITLGGRLMNRR